jgi:hypothetical protein
VDWVAAATGAGKVRSKLAGAVTSRVVVPDSAVKRVNSAPVKEPAATSSVPPVRLPGTRNE